MPRFVVLEHDHPVLHWDLMLEVGDALRTWRLAAPPELNAGPIVAEELPDHRLAYLDYEGPVSGGRGQVLRWDRGVFEWGDAQERCLIVRLQGSRLNGVLMLRQGCTGWQMTMRPHAGTGQL